MKTLYLRTSGSKSIGKLSYFGFQHNVKRQISDARLHSLGASLIPRDPEYKKKYQAKAPVNPTNVRSLSDAEVFGPRGILLFGFDPSEIEIVKSWLSGAPIKMAAMFPGIDGNHHDGVIITLHDALERLDSQLDSFSELEYSLEGLPATEQPIVMFSGLEGTEVIALLDSWHEFTGFSRPCAGTAIETCLHRTLASLLCDIIRAQPRDEPNDPTSSQYAIVSKSGAKEAVRDSLRMKIHEAVQAQQRKKSKEANKDESDKKLEYMRSMKLNDKSSSSGKGFA